jgi:hypothetical protein
MLHDIHQALFETPPGARDERPLIEGIRAVVKAYERGSWLARAILWLLPAIAGAGIAAQHIREWFT